MSIILYIKMDVSDSVVTISNDVASSFTLGVQYVSSYNTFIANYFL